MYPAIVLLHVLALVVPFSNGEDHRIVGDKRAPEGKYPSMGSLRLNDVHICGGSLISEKYAMTAAHCFAKEEASKYEFVFGDNWREVMPESAPTRQAIKAVEIYVHPEYDEDTDYHDITIVLLVKAPVLSNNVQISELVDKLPPVGDNCTVLGYGVLKNETSDVNPIDRLLELDVRIYPALQCNHEDLGDLDPASLLCVGNLEEGKKGCNHLSYLLIGLAPEKDLGDLDPEATLCVGNLKEGRNSCHGDSGSPLYCGGTISGIVSHGVGCARSDSPGIYSSVVHFLPWIQSVLQGQVQGVRRMLHHRRRRRPRHHHGHKSKNLGTTYDLNKNIFYLLITVVYLILN